MGMMRLKFSSTGANFHSTYVYVVFVQSYSAIVSAHDLTNALVSGSIFCFPVKSSPIPFVPPLSSLHNHSGPPFYTKHISTAIHEP